MQENYNPQLTEATSQKKWQAYPTVTEAATKPKYYCLSMFAYPSGKLHMGHVRNYTIGDVLTRYHQLNGYNVMQPFGWDAFGLPAENAAIDNNTSPATWTYQNIDYMREQLKTLGLAINWQREFATCDPSYYKWQQWLFIQLYKRGIIYRKNGTVNWDPIDNTVLANEQVIDGKGWRSGAEVIKKQIPMYYLKITAYAQELLNDLDSLDGWPEQVKTMQRNWIGRKSGANVKFKCNNDDLVVFTTRIDTIMGVSYIAISPEHPLAINASLGNSTIQEFISQCAHQSVAEAQIAKADKLGVFSGLYATHPLSNAQLPIWITNYVLNNYATGAIMGVPGHDVRDYEFAIRYKLPILSVIKPHDGDIVIDKPYIGDGELINSKEFNGLDNKLAQLQITKELAKQGLAEEKTTYRLRDWGISRQRYWGCPIPIIHCDNCGEVLVEEDNLPVILPNNLTPQASGSILATTPEFINTTCPKCKASAKRETDTMDTFVDSSWYYARFSSYDNNQSILDERANYWLSVDQYIGGIEHAILHLLYARFIHKALRDLGLVNSSEPFTNLLTQGMVLANTYYKQDSLSGKRKWYHPTNVKLSYNAKGEIVESVAKDSGEKLIFGGMEKMSKSKNNGVDPQQIISQYGADTARLFMMFAAPPESSLEWSDQGIEGSYRFIKKLWRIIYEHLNQNINLTQYDSKTLSTEQKKLQLQLNNVITKVTNDIAKRKQFNTAISSIMELLNTYAKIAFIESNGYSFARELLKNVVIMLSPIIPHVCEELWQNLMPNSSLLTQTWPQAEANPEQQELKLIIQVNGKLRGDILVNKYMTEEQIKQLALEHTNVKKFIINGVNKIILVPGRLINIVAK